MKKHVSLLLVLCMVAAIAGGCATNKANKGKAADVDLTVLSSTMVYAEVFNIMNKPDEYIGKTIRMRGPYTTSYYDDTKQYYHFVIIKDAAACCQQGLEFIWNGDHEYPADYPKEQTEIEVIGVFGRYVEQGASYFYLAVDDLVVI